MTALRWVTRRVRRSEDEAGLIIIVLAASIVGLVTMIALVVDIGQARADRRTNKSMADFAARAGVGQLNFGPWRGVCKSRDYLLANASQFKSFDQGSEKWSNGATPPVNLAASPCTNTAGPPATTPCTPNNPSTWAKLTATAAAGRITVEIRSGYVLPDPAYPSDLAGTADAGDPDKGFCDNLAVVVTEKRAPLFGAVVRPGGITTKVRSVGRLNTVINQDYIPSLLLLERTRCNVLAVGGANTRVIAQPYQTYPGVIQIDSDASDGNCSSGGPVVNGQATATGPSILACSATSTAPGCNLGIGGRKSRLGLYALNFSRPSGIISTPYPSTYGDLAAVSSPRSGRERIDVIYRNNMLALDADAKATLKGNAGRPPGCSTVVNNACTGNGRTWLVLQQADCNALATFFAVPGRATAQNIWFNCDLNANVPLTLSAPHSYIAVTGQLTVGNAFSITDPRTLYVGGRSTGNRIGFEVSGTTAAFTVNLASVANCAARAGSNRTTTFVVGSGAMKVASGSTLRLCQTFVYLASGFDRLPNDDGVFPCTNGCATFDGTIDLGSNAFVDWSAPNLITGRRADPGEVTGAAAYEDLALWMEAGGNTNTLTGGSTTSMAGIFFMGNADSFNLAGNGALPVYLSAQFIATSMKVSGGATVNLVPNPHDSVPVILYSILLVR